MKTPELDERVEEPRVQLDRALAFLRRALRHWAVFAMMLLVAAIGYRLFTFFRPPLYHSEAVVVFSDAVQLGDDAAHPVTARSVTLRVQEMLTARQVLQRVVDEFNLYPDVRREQGLVGAADELKLHVVLKAPGGDTFTISFDGRSPAEAQRVTARLAELLIDQDFSLRKKEAKVSLEFLGGEKKRADDQLGKAEQGLAEFMAEHPRFALDATPLATGAAIRATVVTNGRAGSGAAGPARFNAFPVGPRLQPVAAETATALPTPPVAPAPDPELARAAAADRSRAEASVAAARTDLAEKQLRFTDAHPDVRAARDAVAQAQARLDGFGPRIAPAAVEPPRVQAAESPRPVRYERPAEAPRTARALRSKAESDTVALETDWSRLTRAVTEARQRHDQVEAAMFKAEISASSASDTGSSQMTVIDPAFLPERPVPPGERTIAAGFGALGLLLGSLFALGLAAIDDRIYDQRGASGLGYVLCEVPRPRRRRRA